MMTEAVLDTATWSATLWDPAAADATVWGTASGDSVMLDTVAWAIGQWNTVELGDARLTRRAVHMGTAMAVHPAQSLPQQCGDPAALKGAYGLLNHPGVTLEQLATPHWEHTRHAAAQAEVVLLVQDTSELDYTPHPTKKGLGPIGNGKGRGLLLHSTVAVVPGETPQVLGLAHHQVVLRQPAPQPRPRDYASPEGQVWAQAAEAVGPPPDGVRWVHVGDRGSDDFRFMHATRQEHHKDFLIRVAHNRLLAWDEEEVAPAMRKVKDYARSLPTQCEYQLDIPARHHQPARTAHMRLAWAPVTIPAPQQGPPELRDQPPITAWVVRTWEVHAPPEVDEPIDWILLTSVPVYTVEDALERVRWYTCRWLVEDYHQCLKTGCAIEQRQFDPGDDIRRLLGFCGPIAVRLLQLRQLARRHPTQPAVTLVAPLWVQILRARLDWPPERPLPMADFWRGVAQLGGYQGRPRNGEPGWKTIWRGWQYLSDLVLGAQLYAASQVNLPGDDSNAPRMARAP
jgi:hypothetical protein